MRSAAGDRVDEDVFEKVERLPQMREKLAEAWIDPLHLRSPEVP